MKRLFSSSAMALGVLAMAMAMAATVMPVTTASATTLEGPTNAAVIVSGPAQPSWCGWKPANDQGEIGQINGNPTNIRIGQSTQCNVIAQGNPPQAISAHCYAVNAAGETWYYIHDLWTGVTGWVRSDLVVTFGSVTTKC